MFLYWLGIALGASGVTAYVMRWRYGSRSDADRVQLADLQKQLLASRETLSATQEALEQTVAARTEELKTINRQLVAEIAERQQLEKALRISQQNYRSIVEDQSEMIVRFTTDGTVTFANKAYCDRYHLTLEECLGTNCFDSIHPDYRALARNVIQQVSHDHPTGTAVIRVARPDGSEDWAEWNGRALYDVDGSLLGYQAIGRIVTNLIETQQRLQESELRYRSIVEGQSEMIIRMGSDGTISFANAAFMRANKVVTGQQPPPTIADFLEPDELRRAQQVISGMTADRPTESIRLRVVRDGRVYWEDWYGHALFDQQDHFLCIQAVGRDVTNLVHAEEELHKKEELLRHASRLSILGEMVAAVTHELRQPLYSISNFAFACQNQLAEQNVGCYDKIKRWNLDIIDQVQRANEIIHRLRGFARRSDTVASSVSIHQVAQEAIALLQFELNHAAVRVVEEFDLDCPVVVIDRLQIEQVLVNLIRNSCDALLLTHSASPKVTISTFATAQGVRVSVADNGPGLPEQELERIFQPFRTNKPEGLGLGLAICRSIIEEHEGEIWAENLRPGLKVQFTLPARAANFSGETAAQC